MISTIYPALFLALAVLAFGLAQTSCSVFSDKSFKVGLYESGEPLVFMESKNSIAGFEVDFAKSISDRIEKKMTTKLLSPDEISEALNKGTVDCVISSLESIHKLMNAYDSTEPFISYGIVIIKLADDTTITDVVSLSGKQVGVAVETDAEALCEEILKVLSFDLRKYDLPNQPLQEIQLKKKDAAVSDEYLARYYEKKYPEIFETLGPVYQIREYGIKFSKKISDEDMARIEEALADMKSDGALSGLYMKWFGYDFLQ